jgi:hypothetical protein
LPGTCTSGTQYQFPGGQSFTCGPTNTYNGSNSNYFNVKAFGAYGNTQSVNSGFTWASQNSIVCSACNFTSADVGKTVYESTSASAAGLMQYGIIGAVSGGQVTSVTSYVFVGGDGGATFLVWGNLDDPAGPPISTAINALWATTLNPPYGPSPRTPTVYFPAGGYMLCGTSAVPAFLALNPPSTGGSVTIQGDLGTILYPCPVPPATSFNSGWLVQNLTSFVLGVNYNNITYQGAYIAFTNKYNGIFDYISTSNNVQCYNFQSSLANPPNPCYFVGTASQTYGFSGSANGSSAIFVQGGGNNEFHMSRTANNGGSGILIINATGAPGSAGTRWIGGQIDESSCTGYNGNAEIENSYDVWFIGASIFECSGLYAMHVDPTSVVHLEADVLGPFSPGQGLKIDAGGKVIATDTRFYAFNSASYDCINNLGTFVNLGGNRCEWGSTVSCAEAAGTTATCTTTYNHRLTAANIGDYVTLYSMTVAAYNCSSVTASDAWSPFCYQIQSAPTANTFTITTTGSALGTGTGSMYVNTWNGGGFAGNPPISDLTPTWNTCYITASPFAGATMCSQPNDRAQYMTRVRATSGVTTSCATPPVLTITNGNVTTTFTLTSGQSVWDTSANTNTFPIASGSMPMYFAPTLPTGANSPTVSITTGTCATPPTNFSVTMYGNSPGLP